MSSSPTKKNSLKKGSSRACIEGPGERLLTKLEQIFGISDVYLLLLVTAVASVPGDALADDPCLPICLSLAMLTAKIVPLDLFSWECDEQFIFTS